MPALSTFVLIEAISDVRNVLPRVVTERNESCFVNPTVAVAHSATHLRVFGIVPATMALTLRAFHLIGVIAQLAVQPKLRLAALFEAFKQHFFGKRSGVFELHQSHHLI